ncbi:MAG: hypothetical protein KatS3mg053_1278 [Candidatus Roseilinea sp.]|nr:MAG: hypothetical protein KatS3mg053_1278 [Candidatus Roseilinea sp.]
MLHDPSPFAQIRARFASPPRDYSPAPIWWWSGDKLERERLKWQLDRFVAGGVYNVVLLNLAPTGPLYGAEADDPEFFSEAWWTIFREVCAHARQVGMRIWVYDQIGFSGANLQAGLVRDHPEWAGQWLSCASVTGSGELSIDCPAEGEPLAASLTPIDDAGAAIGPTTRVPLQGRRAACVTAQPARLRLIYAVKRGFDYTNAAACSRLIDIVHGEYERRAADFFGDVIVGSFQDELPTMPTWGPTFAAAFRQRMGYDLRDHLEWLYDGNDPHAQRVRMDAEAVRASLVEEAFFKPLFDWHERHGLICGFDQQHPARQGHPIAAVGLYADYLRTHRWYGAPGSDHHGEAKVHSSLAHLYDRPRVWIEAFHSSGWGGTLEETFDWLLPWLRAGANLYDPHAAYYSTRGGWWEWAPPSTCWRQPYWQHYPSFAAAVSRLCYMLSQGHHVCDVGVLFPTTTIQANLTPEGPLPRAQAAHDAYTALVGLMTWYDVKPGALDRDRRDFDVLDDDSVQRASIEDGALVIGHERYRAIVLPACTVLHPATAAKLLQFVEGGGRLIAIGALPELVNDDDQTLIHALRARFDNGQASLIPSADHIGEALAVLPRAFDAPMPTLHRRIEGHDVLFVPAAFPRATEIHSRHWLTNIAYDFDPARYRRNMTVRAYGKTTAPQLWDPVIGEIIAAPATIGEGYVDVTIPFSNGPAALLVWDDVSAADSNTESRLEAIAQLGGPWRASLVPTMDNRYGDFALPAFTGAPPLQTWRVEHRHDDETAWREAMLTFGVYGWFIGPDAPEAMPAPLIQPMDGDDPLQVSGWQPAVYSLSRGIAHDRLHIASLGPKGRVPQEFLDFGPVRAGQAVRFRTGVWMDAPSSVHLVIGAPAGKRAWLNGIPIGEDAPGYHWRAPVALPAGYSILEFELRAEQPVQMRAFWALVTDLARFERPEWLTLHDRPVKDSRVRFTRAVDVPFDPVEARLHIGTAGACRVLVNGAEIGRQGGFDPYDGSPRVQRYTSHAFRRGSNQLVVEIQDQGAPIALLVDAEVAGAQGERIAVIGDAGWTAQRDDGPVQPAALRRRQWVDYAYASEADFASGVDPAWPMVRRRPHPLPGAHWLEDAPPDGSVLSVIQDAHGGAPAVEWFRWMAPALATAVHVPVRGQATLYADGVALALHEGRAALPPSDSPTRVITLRVACERGRRGGAAFDGPITYEVAEGLIGLGAWADYGLGAYSGGVRYSTSFHLAKQPEKLILDLGRVRGTAEVWLNGQYVGAKFCAPWHFDLSPTTRAGENALEVRVFNTLGPYLQSVSPTHYIFAGQDVSGLFGPVRLLADDR